MAYPYWIGSQNDLQSRRAIAANTTGETGGFALLFTGLQYLVPSADVATAAWVTDTGATTNLYQAISESPYSDANYIQSPLRPINAETKVRLGAGIAPDNTAAGLHVDWRYRKNAISGAVVNLTVTLYRADGVTAVTALTVALSDTTTNTASGRIDLSAAEGASIPMADYAAGLVLGFSANQS